MSNQKQTENQEQLVDQKRPGNQNQIKLIWIVLGIAAILIMWLLSSLLY